MLKPQPALLRLAQETDELQPLPAKQQGGLSKVPPRKTEAAEPWPKKSKVPVRRELVLLEALGSG